MPELMERVMPIESPKVPERSEEGPRRGMPIEYYLDKVPPPYTSFEKFKEADPDGYAMYQAHHERRRERDASGRVPADLIESPAEVTTHQPIPFHERPLTIHDFLGRGIDSDDVIAVRSLLARPGWDADRIISDCGYAADFVYWLEKEG